MEPIGQVGHSPVVEMVYQRPVETGCSVEVPVLALEPERPVAADSTLPEDAVVGSCLVHRSSAGPGGSGVVLVLEEAHSIRIEAAHRPNLASASDSKLSLQPPGH